MTAITFQRHRNLELANMLVIDGIPDPTSRVNDFLDERWAVIESREVGIKLRAMSCKALSQHFSSLELPLDAAEDTCVQSATLVFSSRREPANILRLNLEFDLASWASPWSIVELIDALQAAGGHFHEFSQSPFGIQYVNAGGTAVARWSIYTQIADLKASADDVIARRLQQTLELLGETLGRLRDRTAGNLLLATFHFPEDVTSACQQYLVYFIQFLRDLGIEATSDLQQDAARVLFSVKPASGAAALGTVREALQIYLNLPSAPEFISASDDHSEFAVVQLRANVLHLQSQLSLARAIDQAKNATIDALQLTNFRLRQLSIVSDTNAGKNSAGASADKESVIGDIVSVTRYQGKGFEVDLPKLFRRLKRRLRIGHDWKGE